MNKPDVRERMLKASFAVQFEGPDQLRARIAREVPMWKELVERAGHQDRLSRRPRRDAWFALDQNRSVSFGYSAIRAPYESDIT